MPSILYVLIILLTVDENLCNNLTGKYNSMSAKAFQSKFSRLLTFNTQEDGDITLELAFNVPFITIPVKKSLDMAQGAIANVNIGAVLLAGALTFGLAVLIPGILIFVSKKMWTTPNSAYRNDDSLNWMKYLSLLDQALTENDIDTTTCMQKVICWTVRNSAQHVLNGQSSSSDKIIDGLATNKWIQQMLDGTVVYSAIQSGKAVANCSQEYSQCKISERSIQILTSNFVENLNGGGK